VQNPLSSARRIRRSALQNQALSEHAQCKTNSFARATAISNFGAKAQHNAHQPLATSDRNNADAKPSKPEAKSISPPHAQ
jgi:hypothetical protein